MSEPRPLVVRFSSAEELTAQSVHIAHGGLLVPGFSPAPTPLEPVLVSLRGPSGEAGPLTARVVQVLGEEVALGFDEPEALRTAIAGLQAEPPGAAEPEGTLFDRIRAMSKAEKRQLALHGDRASRLLLMKDVDKELHVSVILNPGITIDEVRYIAGFRQTNPAVLDRIAANRDWIQYPQVVSALVRNPKTPAKVALRLVDKIALTELRNILRAQQAQPAVLQAIKRKLAG